MQALIIVGSLIGTRMALRHGSGFVRLAFVVVVAGLIVKTTFLTAAPTPKPSDAHTLAPVAPRAQS